MLVELERDAAKCTGITEPGRCRFMSLALAYGLRGHPRAGTIKETLASWFTLIRSSTSRELDVLRDAWAQATPKFVKAACTHLEEDTQSRDSKLFPMVSGVLSNVM